MSPELTLKQLLNEVITKCEIGNDEVVFELANGRRFQLTHQQDCCESVTIESVKGEIDFILNSPVLSALEETSNENPPDADESMIRAQDSFTWTEFKITTEKGFLTIRFYGQSNGWYSEGVDFFEIK
jgi:hypothetical protein